MGTIQVTLFYLVVFPLSVGLLTILLDILLVPILFSIPFACGYTIILLLNIDWNKAKSKPLRAINVIAKRFFTGMVENLTSVGVITKCTYGNWVYIPPFKIERKG